MIALVLTACSSASGGPNTAGGPSTRTITDAKDRTVRVPAQPRRVLALSEPTLDAALTLGVPVVGTTSGRGQGKVSAYLADRATGIPVVATVAGPNLELVAARHPDLILIDGTVSATAVLDKLAGIAPTVFVSVTGQNWKTAFTASANALNRQQQAATELRAFDERVGKVKASLGRNATATVSIVRWGTGVPSVMLKEIAASTVVAQLGLRRPPAQDRVGKGHSSPVSLENLDQLDADWMFFGTLGGATSPGGGNAGVLAGTSDSRRALTTAAGSTPGFAGLRAYQLGHVVPVDGSAWMSAGGPLAEDAVLDSIAAALGAT